jgi:serine/threonine protein phosphatase PrpC
MKRPKSDDRRRLFGRSHPSVDETLVDYGQPISSAPAPQPAGRLVIQCSVATDVGRVRRNNEDFVQAVSIVRDGARYAVWAVADGVGGGPQGERASRTAVETLVDYLTDDPWTDPSTALTDAFALANRNVFEITGEGAAASTMVVALVAEPEGVVCIANVGDSRAYIVAGGEARPITDDHSIVAARVAAGQMTAAEAKTAADRNVLTRSVGSEREVLVDIFGPRQLQPTERLILCTDGVHGMIDDAMIARLGGGRPLGEAAGALVTAAVEAGGKDNATALVGGYGSAAAAVAPPAAGPVAAVSHRPPLMAVVAAGIAALLLAVLALIALAMATPTPGPSSSASINPTAAATATAAEKAAATRKPTSTARATSVPTTAPAATQQPAVHDVTKATRAPTSAPTAAPTPAPTAAPTPAPTAAPTPAPTAAPTPAPTAAPTPAPTASPTPAPTASPTPAPTPQGL